MVYQQLSSNIRRVYAGQPDVAIQEQEARRCRLWLESIELDPALRALLVEPYRVLEEAFAAVGRANPKDETQTP